MKFNYKFLIILRLIVQGHHHFFVDLDWRKHNDKQMWGPCVGEAAHQWTVLQFLTLLNY